MEIITPEPLEKFLRLTENFKLMYCERDGVGFIVKPSSLFFDVDKVTAMSLQNYDFMRKTQEFYDVEESPDPSNANIIDALKPLLYATIAETTPDTAAVWSMIYTNDKKSFETLEDVLLGYGIKNFCEKFDLKPKVEQFIKDVFLNPLAIFEHADRLKIFSNVKNLMLCIFVNFFKVGVSYVPNKLRNWEIIPDGNEINKNKNDMWPFKS
jgi:hypothetical protein